MATASDDESVRVWDLTVRELPVPVGPPLEGHQQAVNSVAIGVNGMMASASDDKTVRLWDLSKLDAIRKNPLVHACARTGRGFNPGEWKRQIPFSALSENLPGLTAMIARASGLRTLSTNYRSASVVESSPRR